MERILLYVFLLFVLSEITATAPDQNLHRFVRTLYNRGHNTTNYISDPNWTNKPQYGTHNRTYSQATYPNDPYPQLYPENPKYPSHTNGGSQNTYGYITPPNGYHNNPPLVRNNTTPWKNPDPHYNQGYPGDIGWRPQSNTYNSTSPRWPNTDGRYYQGNQDQSGYPRPDSRPQYQPPYNTSSGAHNTRPYLNNTQSQGNYYGTQYSSGPNDLMIHRMKRSHRRHHGHYNSTSNETMTDHNDTNHTSDCGRHHRHHHQIYYVPTPPQYGPPPPPPQFPPPPHFGTRRYHFRHGGPPRFNPPPPGGNGTVTGSNGTSISEPEHGEHGFNEGGSELHDLNTVNNTIPSSE